MTDRLRSTMQAALQLCDWINETPHQRGSINGLAAQVGYGLRAVLAEQNHTEVALDMVAPTSKCRLQVAAQEVLKAWGAGIGVHPRMGAALGRLRAAQTVKESLTIAEPVAWMSWADGEGVGYWATQAEAELNCSGDTEPVPLYTAPPRREWVGLTDEERQQILDSTHPDNRWTLAERVEYRLKEKNG